MIHITAQMRVLVRLSRSMDARNRSLVRVCQSQLCEDPFTGCVFIFAAGEERRFACLVMTGRDTGLRRSVFQGQVHLVAGIEFSGEGVGGL